MKELVVTVNSRGEVVIPIEVRKHLGIERGGKIVFVLEDNGRVKLTGVRYQAVISVRGAADKLANHILGRRCAGLRVKII